MSNEMLQQQAYAQAFYMDFLAKEAVRVANLLPHLAFDPQGRVLVDVQLDAEQIQTLVQAINKKYHTKFSLNQQGLQDAVGRPLTPVTTVSLDCYMDDRLYDNFKRKILGTLFQDSDDEIDDASINRYLTISPNSIIPLQQEFHFHLGLVLRIYKTLPPFKDKNLDPAYENALIQVNQLVMQAFVDAYRSAKTVAELNQQLDKARADILPQAHSILVQEIIKQSHVVLSPAELKSLHKVIVETAKKTTSTDNDVVHFSVQEGLATFIAGSKDTAHDTQKKNKFAHRQLITHFIDDSGQVIPHSTPRIQIRTPSPVLKKGLANDHEYITDVAFKLTQIKTHYALSERLPAAVGERPRAYIYNSYTAINDRLGDIGGNLQTQSAHHILKGAHQYNAQQLKQQNPVFCFVQNISVNGFGDTLGYQSSNPLVIETTLMSEMALLHTLYDSLPAEEKTQADTIFKQYKKYLETRAQDSFFSDSNEGIAAIKALNELKTTWQKSLRMKAAGDSEHLIENAKLSLQQIMAYDLHCSHEFSMLIQTLSVFVEDASIGGCKSGNERSQAVNGRVAILDNHLNAMNYDPIIKRSLFDLAHSKTNPHAGAEILKRALDNGYNHYNLYGAASLVSLMDQGGPAKVEGKPKHPFYVSRNFAETNASVMTNLKQTKAAQMQAHKDMPKVMEGAWQGHPKTWWQRMKSSPLGVVGAVLAVITVVPALLVAGYNLIQNYRNKVTTQNSVQQAKSDSDLESGSSSGSSYDRMQPLLASSRLSAASAQPQVKPSHVPVDKSISTDDDDEKDQSDIDFKL